MVDTPLLVTKDDLALPPAAVLASRLGQRFYFPNISPTGTGNTTLPVLPAGAAQMVPGEAYPSAGDASQLLYLPVYQVTAMELVPNATSTSATLTATLTFAAAPTPAAGQTVAVVPHGLRAQLVYTMRNDSDVPTATVRKDFDPVSSPATPTSLTITLSIGDAGDLGQLALALAPQKGSWNTTLLLTADMQVAVPAPTRRYIPIDTGVLFQAMKVDPARLPQLNLQREILAFPPMSTSTPTTTSTTAPPSTTTPTSTTTTSTPEKTMLFEKNVADKLAADRAVAGKLPVNNVAADKLPADRSAAGLQTMMLMRPAPGVGGTPGPLPRPVPDPLPPPRIDPIDPGPRVPIANPPPPHFGGTTTGLVTRPGETVESLSLALVTVQVPLGQVKLPPNTTLKQVPCDGLDLWVDQTLGNTFYFVPQAFRLGLVSPSPGASLVPSFWVTFDGGSGTDASLVDTSLALQLYPHTDPRDVAHARAAAAANMATAGVPGTPTLLVQEPPITQIVWWLPTDSGADQSKGSPAPAASPAQFVQGLTTTLSVTYPQFQRIFDRLQVTWATGLEGAVIYTSPEDPTLSQSVPIVVNLHDFEVTALTAVVAPAGTGGVALTLTSMLPFDLRVDAVVVQSTGATLALPVAPADRRVPAGGSATLAATGTGGAIPAASDLAFVWQGTPTSDQLGALCAEVVGTQVVAPTPVALAIETLVGFFRPGVGAKQLTKLDVTFTDVVPQVKVELSAGVLTATVSLAPNLLLSLVNDPASTRFAYQVTNVYDDGSTVAGPSLTWDGGSPLVVEANPPEGQAHAAT